MKYCNFILDSFYIIKLIIKGLVRGTKANNWLWFNDTQVVDWDRGLKETLEFVCPGFRPYTLIYEREKLPTAGKFLNFTVFYVKFLKNFYF